MTKASGTSPLDEFSVEAPAVEFRPGTHYSQQQYAQLARAALDLRIRQICGLSVSPLLQRESVVYSVAASKGSYQITIASQIKWASLLIEPVRWADGHVVALVERPVSPTEHQSVLLWQPSKRKPGRPYRLVHVPGAPWREDHPVTGDWVISWLNWWPVEPPWSRAELQGVPVVPMPVLAPVHGFAPSAGLQLQ